MSAMTLLGRNEDNKEGASYLEIADAINRESAQPGQDRLELWRRVTFSAMTGNIDAGITLSVCQCHENSGKDFIKALSLPKCCESSYPEP